MKPGRWEVGKWNRGAEASQRGKASEKNGNPGVTGILIPTILSLERMEIWGI